MRSQLACTAKRLPAADGLPIVAQLLHCSECAQDTHIPLLIWWAIEDKAISDRDEVLALLQPPAAWQLPLVQGTIVERLARRYLAESNDAGYAACARLLALAPTPGDVRLLVAAMERHFTGQPLERVPAPLVDPIAKLWREHGADPIVTRLALQLGSAEAYAAGCARMADRNEKHEVRLALIAAVGQAGDPDVVSRLLPLLQADEPEPIRLADAGRAGTLSTTRQSPARCSPAIPNFPQALRTRAIGMLASRPAWAAKLIAAVQAKTIDAKDVSVDDLRQMLAHDDAALAAAIEASWGKIRPATPGEKMSYVPVLGRVLGAGPGDRASGHELFTKHCASATRCTAKATRSAPI